MAQKLTNRFERFILAQEVHRKRISEPVTMSVSYFGFGENVGQTFAPHGDCRLYFGVPGPKEIRRILSFDLPRCGCDFFRQQYRNRLSSLGLIELESPTIQAVHS